MSLRVVHIVFVASAILLSLGLGVGLILMFRQQGGGSLILLGIAWLACGVGLAYYGKTVLRKLRTLSRL
jgi:hypothetical protein